MYFRPSNFDKRVDVHFSQLTEMYASCFAFGDSETVCVSPMSNFPDALLHLTLGSSHIFRSGSDAEVINRGNPRVRHFVMLFIFILNSITDKILPCETPSSCLWRLERLIRLGISCWRKNAMNLGKAPHMLCRSFIIPNFQVVS